MDIFQFWTKSTFQQTKI